MTQKWPLVSQRAGVKTSGANRAHQRGCTFLAGFQIARQKQRHSLNGCAVDYL